MTNKPLALKCDCKNEIYAIPEDYGIGRCPHCQKEWSFVKCPECKTIEPLTLLKEALKPQDKTFLCIGCEKTYPIPDDTNSKEVKMYRKDDLSPEQKSTVSRESMKTKLLAFSILVAAIILVWVYFSLK